MNHHCMRMMLAGFLAALLPFPTRAGTDAGVDTTARAHGSLIVRTDADSAVVVLDGHRAGVTPLELDSVSAGTHLLRVFHPDAANWLTGSVADSVQIGAGESVIRSYSIAGEISLNSNPSGAGIYLRDSLLGFTPLLLPRDSSVSRSILTLSKAGYTSLLLQPDDVRRGFVFRSLSPVWPGESQDILETSVRPERNRTGLYLSGATAVLAGIATAYLKIQADERQDRYAITGDPDLISQRNRLDRGAAVTYVITQIGFGIFAYFLLSD